MAEKDELIRRNASRKSYGSVRQDSTASEPRDEGDNYNDDQRPVRCLCTRRDTILISVLAVLVVAAITASLAVGIPKIQEKERRLLQEGSLTPLPPLPNAASSVPPKITSSAPDTPSPAPVASSPAPVASSPAPVASSPAPVASNPAPVASSPAPVESSPAPVAASVASDVPSLSPTDTLLEPVQSANSSPAASPQQEARFKRAAVSADDERCAQIGSNLLRQNGSAVDAAIGTLVCLEAVHPHHSGIGGGFFMTIYSRAQSQGFVIDAREVAPSKASWDMYQGNSDLSATGGLSVAVPGAVRGYWEAHQKFGKLPWKTLFEPTIAFCRQGYKVGQTLAKAFQTSRDSIIQEETLREIFVSNVTNDVLNENETLVRPGFANTLQTIADQGANVFYEGSLAEQLVADVTAKGGIMTLDDLRNYTVLHKQPLLFQGFRKGFQALSVPPPGSGSVVALILNILTGYNATTFNVTDIHRMIEAMKFAYAKRTELGDENFVNVTRLVQNMTSLEYAASLRSLIRDNQTFDPKFYGPNGMAPSDQGTSHVSVIAPNGDAVAVTSTINLRFGAKFRSRSLDIILNDEMDDFSSPNLTNFFGVEPSRANAILPGKRPLSSMAPTIILNNTGHVELVIGAAGGIAIPTSMVNVISRQLFAQQNLSVAVSAPRVHHQLFPNVLYSEPSFPTAILNTLAEFGHNVTFQSPPETHVNAILKQQDGSYVAVSDPRIESGTDGF